MWLDDIGRRRSGRSRPRLSCTIPLGGTHGGTAGSAGGKSPEQPNDDGLHAATSSAVQSDKGVPVRSLSDLFRNFMQVGYVTDDIDAAAEYLESTLGTVQCVKTYGASMGGGLPQSMGGEPGSVYVVVDGKPADEWVIDVLLVNAGPTNLEVIKPVSGSVELYRGAVRPGVPMTKHHLAFRVDDFDEATAVVQATGRSWAQYGETGRIRMGYLDMTAELGHYVEVMELADDAVASFAALEAASNAGPG
jgi:hypothetical protein